MITARVSRPSQWELDRMTQAERRELARRGSRVGVTKPTVAARKARRRSKARSR